MSGIHVLRDDEVLLPNALPFEDTPPPLRECLARIEAKLDEVDARLRKTNSLVGMLVGRGKGKP